MKILFLTYYFEPDLCAGSFRNSSLFKELVKNAPKATAIDVVTTFPNRYDSFDAQAHDREVYQENVIVNRIKLPKHGGGIKGQIAAFWHYYKNALKLTKGEKYDLVYASSSRLFTAFLGSRIARKSNAKLYLDIRDIFRETIVDVFESKVLKLVLDISLRPLEKYTFARANHINLVSKGFQSYFSKYKQASFSYFTNGIDQVFIDQFEQNKTGVASIHKKSLIYAGNIGDSQGLDKIIPQAALKFPDHTFLIIGDGGAKPKLIEEIKRLHLKNVELHDPVPRNELIEKYQESGYLFLHLNDYKAFERVLPSKLFEYATFNKPIIAGVGGYAAQFIKEELPSTLLFNPTDVNGFENVLKNFNGSIKDSSDFVKKYDRSTINKTMSMSIINTYEK